MWWTSIMSRRSPPLFHVGGQFLVLCCWSCEWLWCGWDERGGDELSRIGWRFWSLCAGILLPCGGHGVRVLGWWLRVEVLRPDIAAAGCCVCPSWQRCVLLHGHLLSYGFRMSINKYIWWCAQPQSFPVTLSIRWGYILELKENKVCLTMTSDLVNLKYK